MKTIIIRQISLSVTLMLTISKWCVLVTYKFVKRLASPRNSHLLWVFKRTNPRPRRGARRTDPEHMPFSKQANPFVARAGVIIMQLNAEGLTKAKCAVIKHLMEKHKATAIFLQETHSLDPSTLKISGNNLAACNNSSAQRTATFVKNSASWTPINSSKTQSEVEWTAMQIEGTTVVNVYKSPNKTIKQLHSCLCFSLYIR